MTLTNSDREYIRRARVVAQNSPDPNTKVGCLIVFETEFAQVKVTIAEGWNRPPLSMDLRPEMLERPAKYNWMGHAETMAIANAARRGKSTQGATMYQTALYPCPGCANSILSAGIRRLVCPEPTFDDPKWGESFKVSAEMLRGIEVVTYKPEEV